MTNKEKAQIAREVAAEKEALSHHFMAQLAKVEAERDALRAALAAVMLLIDDGRLVRDISHDHESDWALKQISFVQVLQQAEAALATKEAK